MSFYFWLPVKRVNRLITATFLGCGRLRLVFAEEDKKIPFFLELIEVDEQLKAAVWNGDEQIVHDSIRFNGDTLVAESPYFNSSLELTFAGNNVTGFFVDYSRKEYKMPLTGKYNLSQRFRYSGPLETKIDGKWEVSLAQTPQRNTRL